MRWLFFRDVLSTNYMLTHNDFAYQAQQFIYIPAKETIDLDGMDFAYQGEPFIPNLEG